MDTTTDWRHRSACQGVDPELFFPVGTTGPALAQIARAKGVCGSCPVITDCLTEALDTGPDGVWGGTTEDERHRMRRRSARRRMPQAGSRPAAGEKPDLTLVARVLDGKPPARRLSHAERVEVTRQVVVGGGGFNHVMALLRCGSPAARGLIAEASATS